MQVLDWVNRGRTRRVNRRRLSPNNPAASPPEGSVAAAPIALNMNVEFGRDDADFIAQDDTSTAGLDNWPAAASAPRIMPTEEQAAEQWQQRARPQWLSTDVDAFVARSAALAAINSSATTRAASALALESDEAVNAAWQGRREARQAPPAPPAPGAPAGQRAARKRRASRAPASTAGGAATAAAANAGWHEPWARTRSSVPMMWGAGDRIRMLANKFKRRPQLAIPQTQAVTAAGDSTPVSLGAGGQLDSSAGASAALLEFDAAYASGGAAAGPSRGMQTKARVGEPTAGSPAEPAGRQKGSGASIPAAPSQPNAVPSDGGTPTAARARSGQRRFDFAAAAAAAPARTAEPATAAPADSRSNSVPSNTAAEPSGARQRWATVTIEPADQAWEKRSRSRSRSASTSAPSRQAQRHTRPVSTSAASTPGHQRSRSLSPGTVETQAGGRKGSVAAAPASRQAEPSSQAGSAGGRRDARVEQSPDSLGPPIWRDSAADPAGPRGSQRLLRTSGVQQALEREEQHRQVQLRRQLLEELTQDANVSDRGTAANALGASQPANGRQVKPDAGSSSGQPARYDTQGALVDAAGAAHSDSARPGAAQQDGAAQPRQPEAGAAPCPADMPAASSLDGSAAYSRHASRPAGDELSNTAEAIAREKPRQAQQHNGTQACTPTAPSNDQPGADQPEAQQFDEQSSEGEISINGTSQNGDGWGCSERPEGTANGSVAARTEAAVAATAVPSDRQ